MQFLSTTLVLEAFVVLFATVVAVKFVQIEYIRTDVSITTVWIIGGVLALFLLVASRMQKNPYGIYFGAVLQVPFAALGFFVDMMFFVAAVFVALWIASWWLGRKIDTERAEYDRLHPDEAPNM